jgi:hypothetical protein
MLPLPRAAKVPVPAPVAPNEANQRLPDRIPRRKRPGEPGPKLSQLLSRRNRSQILLELARAQRPLAPKTRSRAAHRLAAGYPYKFVSRKKSLPKPAWYKNTYFWIALVLLLLGIWGLPSFGGDTVIRDPGQKRESNLYILYLVASVVMLANGILSHRQTEQQYAEEMELKSHEGSE